MYKLRRPLLFAIILVAVVIWLKNQPVHEQSFTENKKVAQESFSAGAPSPDGSSEEGSLVQAIADEDFVDGDFAVTFAPSHTFSGRKKRSYEPHEKEMLRSGLRFLSKNREQMGLTEEDLATTALMDGYTSKHNGVTHLYLRQQHVGIEVWNGDINLNLQNGKVIHYGDRFVSDLANHVNRTKPVISSKEAVAFAAEHLQVKLAPLKVLENWEGPADEVLFSKGNISMENIPTKLVYFSERGTPNARLAWNLVVYMENKHACWDMCIDAENGKVLTKANWVSNFQSRVVQMPMAAPNDPGNSSPNNDSRLLLTDPHDTSASPFGWLDDDGVAGNEYTDTRGNNVWAQEDADGDDTGGFRPDGGASNVFDFDFPINFATATPNDYRDSDITNLFYWNNICHDVFWRYGFDEASGNFQANNYGNGGSGGDQVNADALDGSGDNNANFYTPPEGSNPRMQMFEFTQTTPRRSSSLDNLIIVHEYAHGVSTRLTGGSSNSSCLQGDQSGGMGEGWGDWLGLVLTAKVTDTRATQRPVGTYVLGEDAITGAGIRPAPYSPDMAVNNLTYGSLNGGGLSRPHGYGTVWCTTIWDLYWDFVDQDGFDPDIYSGTGGNNKVLQLVMDGMKMQPCDPSFVDARDAILAADVANNAGANQDLIWAAFARRGLGASAVDDNGGTNPTETFDLPDDLRIDTLAGMTSIGPAGGPFSPSSKVYQLSNVGSASVNWTATKTQPWLDMAPASGTLAPGATVDVTISLNTAANALTSGIHNDTATFTNTDSSNAQTRDVALRIDVDDYTEQYSGDYDLAQLQLTFTPDGNQYDVCRQSITELPLPTGSNILFLSDDDSTEVNFTGGKQFAYFGASYSSVHVGSNGYVTLGGGDSTYEDTLANHFSSPRISLLFTDMNPNEGSSSISTEQLSNRMVITYSNLQPYGGGTPSTVQLELHFDGTIRISWLSVGVSSGITGLSSGAGIPIGYVETDLSTYPECPPPDLLVVTPGGGIQISGAEGGPFTPTTSTFQLQNTDTNPIDWTATASEPWVTISSNGDNLSSGSTVDLDVNLNIAAANLLSVGTYTAVVNITNTQSGYVHERNVQLRISDPLSVTPDEDYAINGPAGGPFTPASKTYTLTNTGTSPLNWTLSESADWLSTTATSGTVQPGNFETVDLIVAPATNSLPEGGYTTTAVLTNTTSGSQMDINVVLRIGDYSTEEFSPTDTFDLANTQLSFTASQGVSYRVCHNDITAFPHSVTNATELSLEDDDSFAAVFSGGAMVNFFGISYSSLYIGSNGYITLGQPDIGFDQTLPAHFNQPRISALFDDLDPTAGSGQIYWEQLSDRVVVTYDNVLEFGGTGTNSFQIEVFFTGDIRISYLGITSDGSIVGVSEGTGLPGDFVETDFSATDECAQIVSVEAVDLEAQELETSNTASFKVNRDGPLMEPLNVFFSVGGSAILGLDYGMTASGVAIPIPAGESSVNVTITAIDDANAEGDELINFNISANAAYTLVGSTEVVVTLKDHPVDAWRFIHFGGNPAGSGDLENIDGDGYVNLLEYALGTDPKVFTAGAIQTSLETDEGTDYLTFTYNRDTSLPDITYQVESSTTLQSPSWSNLDITEVTLSTLETVETRKARVPIDSTQKFLRLRVGRIK